MSGSRLADLAARADVGLDEVAAHLDGLDGSERVRQVRTLARGEQRSLWRKAEAAAPMLLAEDLVPEGVAPRTEVRHHGWNSLPVPGPLRRFEKRFARPDDGSSRLFGYNEGASRPWIGPGYFVAIPTDGRPEWQRRGAAVVDYFQVPDGPVPAGWPGVVPNEQGLQWFVYRHTRDFMRRVSRHVSIGAAYKGERSLDHYFLLCREG